MFERRNEKVGEDGNETRGVEMMVELFLEADGVLFDIMASLSTRNCFSSVVII